MSARGAEAVGGAAAIETAENGARLPKDSVGEKNWAESNRFAQNCRGGIATVWLDARAVSG